MKQTPLYETHVKHNGKIVDFGGWALPIEYEGIFPEYEAVRQNAGLFDVSHMGEYEIRGTDAEAFIQKITTNDVSKIAPGQTQYTLMCHPNGGTVDDILVYKHNFDHFLVVVNAANDAKDGKWLQQNRFGNAQVIPKSSQTAQLALQGPKAQSILQKLTDDDLSQIKFFRFKDNVKVANVPVLISRTGYTGEDGFEFYFAPEHAETLWNAIVAEGAKPCALGARDLLRFESGLPLYGQEISDIISPLTAGLDRFVKLDKPSFIGKDALLAEKENGSPKSLIAFAMEGRAVPREEYPIRFEGENVGSVTHGTFSPFCQKSIGLGYVSPNAVGIGHKIEIEIRGKIWAATIVQKPFYSRKK